MTTIPDRHAAAACPACSVGITCRLVRTGHLRYWELYRANPAKWGPVILADAIDDRDGTTRPTPERTGHRPCKHRSARGHCGEISYACALGHGQAGIVEPESDCVACEAAEV